MNYRILGKTNLRVSEVSLGTWQLGGKWGEKFDEVRAEKILHESIDRGVNFIDTADVYGDRLSEKVVGKVVKERPETLYVASKSGRRLNPHNAEGYNTKNLTGFIDESLKNMRLESIDLIQLHCPPTSVYQKDEVFQCLDDQVKAGKIKHYGVSVERVEEALLAMEYPGVATVQIIFNIFRQKPAEEFFKQAKENNVGILARVPLASGLLTGKFDQNTRFAAGDHRNFNREGKFFDKGETFSGVEYELGLKAVEQLKELFGSSDDLYLYALKWVLMFPEISCVIPGASRVEQAINNVKASEMQSFSDEQMKACKKIYDEYIRNSVHHLW